MEILIPILIVLVLVFGFGVVAVNRARSRRGGIDIEPPAPGGVIAPERPPPEVKAPEPEAPPVEVEVAPETAAEIEEALAPVEVVEVIERPRFRDRLAKARAAFATAFTSVRSRRGIDEDTWDDLEDALLSA